MGDTMAYIAIGKARAVIGAFLLLCDVERYSASI